MPALPLNVLQSCACGCAAAASFCCQQSIFNDDFSVAQIILCEKIKFNLRDDTLLFKDLIALGANRQKLLDMLATMKDIMEKELKTDYSGFASLDNVRAGSRYLSQLIRQLQKAPS